MAFDLNEKAGDDLLLENSNGEMDEVDIYRHFEEQYRANEVLNDDIGVRENIYGWDLNVEAIDELNGLEDQVETDVNGSIDDQVETDDVISDGDDRINNLSPPAVDDLFETLEEACKYYELFGKQSGFGVFKRSNHKNKDFSQHYTLACSKSKKPKTSNEGRIPKRRRAVVGTGCKTCIKLKNTDITGAWVVVEVCLEHNHILQPESSFLISGYRYIPKRLQDLLNFHEEGLSVAANINLVIKGAGGYLRCPFTKKDARNHIDKYRRNKLQALGGDDCHLIFEYFQNKQTIDRNFYYTYNCTSDSRLWNIFWSDGRSRAAYKYFHDVVVLDATYLTNRYDMPLVLFVGANHHGQTTIFVCALLERESEDDYKWCMSRFLQCMNNVKPVGVLTDQCPSIELGVKHVFGEETVHRYCSWHILHKLPTKWGNVGNKSEKTKWVKSVVYDSQPRQEFEQKWLSLMVKVGKQNDAWFKGIYAMRERWVPAFLSAWFK